MTHLIALIALSFVIINTFLCFVACLASLCAEMA
jgi:hypothetical protein